MAKPAFRVSRSFATGRIAVHGTFKGGAIDVKASANLTVEEVRALVFALTTEVDRVEAKLAKDAAEVARRKVWRDREIAAGRLKVMSLRDVFG